MSADRNPLHSPEAESGAEVDAEAEVEAERVSLSLVLWSSSLL
jgi:hypothetical protein